MGYSLWEDNSPLDVPVQRVIYTVPEKGLFIAFVIKFGILVKGPPQHD